VRDLTDLSSGYVRRTEYYLFSAESLQRQHEGFERDLAALEGRVEDIRGTAATLSESFSENAEGIADQEAEVVGAWERLTEKCASRKQQLQESLQLQRFLSDAKDLVCHNAQSFNYQTKSQCILMQVSWMRNVHSLVGTNEPIKDVASAEAALKLHYDHKAEIDARASRLNGVVMFGQSLVRCGHPSASQVTEKLDALEREKMELQLFWEDRKNILQWTLDLEQFERDANIADGWMTSREGLLATEDIGENMENIDDLLQQHMDFEKALQAQEDKMKALDEHANKLVAGQLGWVN
jgi:spectrin alpha